MVGKSQTTLAGRRRLRVVNVRLSLPPSSGQFSIITPNEDHSIDEERWLTMGCDKKGVILVVIHTFKVQSRNKRDIRIISARKATKNEIKQYEGEAL